MTVPTYAQLYTSISTDLRNRLGIRFIVGKVVLSAFAAVQAAKLKLLYLLAAFVFKNIFVDTADPESVGGSLERFGRVKLGRDPFPATAGEYKLNVTGEIGATIGPNTTFKSLDDSTNPGKLYILDSAFTFTSTTGLIQVRALDPGSGARLEILDSLQVTAPIVNVDSFADVDSVEVTPTEGETIEEYRATTIQSYQLEPQGGAKTDYRIWAQDAAGVREVYPYVEDGEPCKIRLFVEANASDSTDGLGTPSQSILDDVEEVAEYDPDTTKPDNERGRRPMGTFEIYFVAIILNPVDVEITNLSDTSYLTTITNSITAYLLNIRPFIDGADNPNLAAKGKLYASDIVNIVRDVLGINATFDSVEMSVNSIVYQQFEFDLGNIPYTRNVTNIVV